MPLKLPSFTGHCLERARRVRSKTATPPLGKNRFMFHVSSKAASSILRSIRLQIIDVFLIDEGLPRINSKLSKAPIKLFCFIMGIFNTFQYIADHSCAI